MYHICCKWGIVFVSCSKDVTGSRQVKIISFSSNLFWPYYVFVFCMKIQVLLFRIRYCIMYLSYKFYVVKSLFSCITFYLFAAINARYAL